MLSIDAAILSLTERFCRRFQLLTGRTNVWLAFQLTNLSIVVYFVWAAIQFWEGEGAPRLFLALFAGGVLYLLSQTIFRVPVETYEASTFQRVSKGLRNPRRLRDQALRLPFLTLSLLLLYPTLFLDLQLPLAGLGYSLVVLTTIVLYLLACDPLPPCPGRVREWLRSRGRYGRADAVADPVESGTSMRTVPSCRDVMNSSPSRLRLTCKSARVTAAPRVRSTSSRNDM